MNKRRKGLEWLSVCLYTYRPIIRSSKKKGTAKKKTEKKHQKNYFSFLVFTLLLRLTIVKNILDKKWSSLLEAAHFPELKNWQPDPEKDFIDLEWLADKTRLVIFNVVHISLAEQIRAYMKK